MANNFKTVQAGANPLSTDVDQFRQVFTGQADVGPLSLAAAQVVPATPLAVASGVGNLNGNYYFKVVFVTGWKQSDGSYYVNGFSSSLASTLATIANGQGSITGIALGAAGIIGRAIYRTLAGGAAGTEKFSGIIWDNTTTSYMDNTLDGNLGLNMPTSASNPAAYGTAIPAAVPTANTTGTSLTVSASSVNGHTAAATPNTVEQVDLIGMVNEVNTNFGAHTADSTYQTAGGTATTLTLTIKGTLSQGYPINFIASANNTGALTTINGKKLYKPNTTTSPNLIAGKPYTAFYSPTGDGGNGCFFIKASAEGNTTAPHVLAGDTFSNDSDTGLLGTMPNNGTVIISSSTSNQTIPMGYHDGNGYVKPISYTAGDTVQYSGVGITIPDYNKWLCICSTMIAYGGTIRVKWTVTHGGGMRSDTQIYVNSVARGILHTETYTSSFSEDITINAGDYVQIYGFNPNSTGTVISAISFCTAQNAFGTKIL